MIIARSNRSDDTYTSGTALTANTETDLLPGGSGGYSAANGDVLEIALQETLGVLVDTITVYHSPSGGIFVPRSATTSVDASGKRSLVLRGVVGSVRVTGLSVAGGASVKADAAWYVTPGATPHQFLIDGVDTTAASDVSTAIASLQTSIENNNVWITDSRGSHLVTRGAR